MLIARYAIFCLGVMVWLSPVSALNMKVQTIEDEQIAYVNMWGEIESGDDQKFRTTILPYLKSGFLVAQVNIFSRGGNVHAAMEIGNQIRTLQTRTVGPYWEGIIYNNRHVKSGRISCGLTIQNGWQKSYFGGSQKKSIRAKLPDNDQFHGGYRKWCDCASACFLIWASGTVREGGYIGVHRFYWKGKEFGKLSPSEARAKYRKSKEHYVKYLKKLDVPQSIIDRMFAVDSRSIYYFTQPELKLLQSTPYIEEMTYSRCGRSKATHMTRANNWTAKYDNEHTECYNGILKEVLREGAKAYLRKYGP